MPSLVRAKLFSILLWCIFHFLFSNNNNKYKLITNVRTLYGVNLSEAYGWLVLSNYNHNSNNNNFPLGANLKIAILDLLIQ